MTNGLIVGVRGEEIAKFDVGVGGERGANAGGVDGVWRGQTVATGTPMTVIDLVLGADGPRLETEVLKTEIALVELVPGRSLCEKRELIDDGGFGSPGREKADVRDGLLWVTVITVLFVTILTTDAIICESTEMPGTPTLDLEEGLGGVVGRTV